MDRKGDFLKNRDQIAYPLDLNNMSTYKKTHFAIPATDELNHTTPSGLFYEALSTDLKHGLAIEKYLTP